MGNAKLFFTPISCPVTDENVDGLDRRTLAQKRSICNFQSFHSSYPSFLSQDNLIRSPLYWQA